MKKFMLFLMCGMLLLTFVGCGEQPKTPSNIENSITDTKEDATNNEQKTKIDDETSETNNESDKISTETVDEGKKITQDNTTTNAGKNVSKAEPKTVFTEKEDTSNTNQPTVKAETTNEVPEKETEEQEDTLNVNTTHTPTDIELEVLKYLNIEREKVGLKKLTYNGSIYDCGVIRANESLVKWSHTRPNGTKYWTIFEECDKPITTCCGENLAKTFTGAEQIVNMLMNSDSHRANILYEDFVSVCITVLKDENGYYYMSQLFMGK